jgi:hypothetical protein
MSTEPQQIDITRTLRTMKIVIGLLVFLVLLSASGFVGYYLYDKKQESGISNTSEKAKIIERVAQLALVPTGEEPVFATVTDPKQLNGQVFFERAQVGDNVLIYRSIERAILYRPSLDRVVEIAPYDEDPK